MNCKMRYFPLLCLKGIQAHIELTWIKKNIYYWSIRTPSKFFLANRFFFTWRNTTFFKKKDSLNLHKIFISLRARIIYNVLFGWLIYIICNNSLSLLLLYQYSDTKKKKKSCIWWLFHSNLHKRWLAPGVCFKRCC